MRYRRHPDSRQLLDRVELNTFLSLARTLQATQSGHPVLENGSLNLLFLTDDLMFSSRVNAVATELGADLSAYGNTSKLLAAAAEQENTVVLIDLAMIKLGVVQVVSDLKALPQSPNAILAYGPHVHEKILAAAADAGCDHVFTRGEFNAKMQSILGHFVQA